MQMSQYHYLPLAPGFFAILVGIFCRPAILRSVRYAYVSLGVSSGTACAVVRLAGRQLSSISRSRELPPEQVMSDQVDRFLRHALRRAGRQSLARAQ